MPLRIRLKNIISAMLVLLSTSVWTNISLSAEVSTPSGGWDAYTAATVSEEMHLLLSEQLARLGRSAMNLQLPDAHTRDLLFAESLTTLDLTSPGKLTDIAGLPGYLGIRSRSWKLQSKPTTVKHNRIRLWPRFLGQVEWFETASFKHLRGEFLSPEKTRYRGLVQFNGLTRMKVGPMVSVRGEFLLDWERRDPSEGTRDKPRWLISAWRTSSFKTLETDRLLFREVLNERLSNPSEIERAQRSIPEEHVRDYIGKPHTFTPPTRYFDHISHDRHPGLAVVDINDDGWDDLYVMAQWGPNQLFRNRGDGTFEDTTERAGAADVGFGMAATLGDYDNDSREDLYISNMFSKAGTRVTNSIQTLDSRFSKMAQGNTLFHNEGNRFRAVSGTEPDEMHVQRTGWSWGSQFVDIDNDGWQDLAVSNGYFTAPDPHAIAVDL